MLSIITQDDVLPLDEKCLCSTETSDYSDSNSVRGQSSPKQNEFNLQLSPGAPFNDFESSQSYTSA